MDQTPDELQAARRARWPASHRLFQASAEKTDYSETAEARPTDRFAYLIAGMEDRERERENKP